MTWSK
jgi:hypothetical protein